MENNLFSLINLSSVIIENLLKRCPSEGCEEEFKLSDLEVHLSNCAFAEEKVLQFEHFDP